MGHLESLLLVAEAMAIQLQQIFLTFFLTESTLVQVSDAAALKSEKRLLSLVAVD